MSADNPVVRRYTIPLERYPHLNENQTIHDAVQVIMAYTCGENERLRYSEIMVINDQNKLVGRINLQSILMGLDSRLVELAKVKKFEGKGTDFPNLAIMWEDSFFEGCSRQSGKAIKTFLTPIRHIVKGGDPLLKALSIMLSTNEVILPVLEEEAVVGVIRLEEIFKGISTRCRL